MSDNRVSITEYLEIDVDSERWHCSRCQHDIGPAREPYKKGLLVYDRDPTEIHRPILDPTKYDYTYAPDPKWCRIIEFYCPTCGTMIENEYLPPGHPLTNDIELDLDKMKAKYALGKGGENATS
jgi:acetone carboxylase gamma subunit